MSSYQNSYFRESVPGDQAEGVWNGRDVGVDAEEVIATLNQQLQEYKDRVIEETKETEQLYLIDLSVEEGLLTSERMKLNT